MCTLVLVGSAGWRAMPACLPGVHLRERLHLGSLPVLHAAPHPTPTPTYHPCPSSPPPAPQLPAVMLACARIGAVFSVVFAGFSAESLAGRISDSGPKMVRSCFVCVLGPARLQELVSS